MPQMCSPLPISQILSFIPRSEETTDHTIFPRFIEISPDIQNLHASHQTNRYHDTFLLRTSVGWNHLPTSIVQIPDAFSFKTTIYHTITEHFSFVQLSVYIFALLLLHSVLPTGLESMYNKQK